MGKQKHQLEAAHGVQYATLHTLRLAHPPRKVPQATLRTLQVAACLHVDSCLRNTESAGGNHCNLGFFYFFFAQSRHAYWGVIAQVQLHQPLKKLHRLPRWRVIVEEAPGGNSNLLCDFLPVSSWVIQTDMRLWLKFWNITFLICSAQALQIAHHLTTPSTLTATVVMWPWVRGRRSESHEWTHQQVP